ncbi:glycosyltransferase [Nostoc sp.]|uniref:glycosyltransferase n=1 Tax=Nostoc sp. TaxID=1180 RepID=UPI002FF7BE26
MINNITKPKLVFFQYRPKKNLPEFILLHRQQHVKCLSEFFDITVINEDCDYQQICDQYQPDLTLFESGVNYKGCQRLKIKNTHVYPGIPKLGLHNGDSWCEARTGFLSDMGNWGIETFFSISTTTPEHIPAIAEKLFVWPNFIDPETYRDYSQLKIVPVLFTGATDPLYPWRQRISKMVSESYPSLIWQHPGYNKSSTSILIYGEQYARTINASWVVPTCGSVVKEIVRKHFEIPGSKSCLITEKSPILESAGFIDMINCVFADETDVLDKLDYLFQNQQELHKITNAGYQLVHARHTLKQRDQIFQWFNLYKNIKPNQKIVQTSPFGSLKIIEQSSVIKNSHIICNGLIIDLLNKGDEKLWAGKYQEAQTFYLQCLHYKTLMPEPKLKLALCSLYQGNPDIALYWIIQPIKYTLEEYKAIDPDPVEWAYYIISLLCQGKLNESTKIAHQFPLLHCSELDYTRWVINILNNKINKDENLLFLTESRYSVHQLPNQSLNEWVEHICIMLKACHQFSLLERLNNSVPLKSHYLQEKKIIINYTKLNKLFNFMNIFINQIYSIVKKKVSCIKFLFRAFKCDILKFLHFLEKLFGFFLPYRISQIKNDEFFSAIQKLSQEEDIKSALVIGASSGEGTTEALLTGIKENPKNPYLFCIDIAKPRFVKLQKRLAHDFFVQCYTMSSHYIEKLDNETESWIKKIQQENKITFFDIVLIDGSEFTSVTELKELSEAKYLILDDINIFHSYKNYQKLVADCNYLLLAHNANLRNGYAIFKKIR